MASTSARTRFHLYVSILACLSPYVVCQRDTKADGPCDPWTSEWTRDSSDCSLVYNCVFGQIIQTHQCNDSRVWSNFGHACVMPMSQWDDCNQIPTTPVFNDLRCVHPDGINPDPDNCAQFLACNNRTVLATMKCPANTLFSVSHNNTCALAFLVASDCKDRTIPIDVDISTPVPVIDKPCSTGPNGDQPDENDCRRFYKCNYGRVVARIRCPRGLAFSKRDKKCDWRARVACSLQGVVLLAGALEDNHILLVGVDVLPCTEDYQNKLCIFVRTVCSGETAFLTLASNSFNELYDFIDPANDLIKHHYTGTSHDCAFNRVDEYGGHFTAANDINDINKHIWQRQYGLQRGNLKNFVKRYVSRQMPLLFREHEHDVGTINKIFTSHWLSDRQVAFGTKCNKLVVLDLVSGQMTYIPLLRSSDNSIAADCACGIHSLAVNPSRTLLATGAEHTNDLAIYKLPTFDPVCIGEGAHKDWLFDMTWIDDQFVVTGSRDSQLALWRIRDDQSNYKNMLSDYYIKSPDYVSEVTNSEKVRALTFNENRQELAVLSLNARLHIWDIGRFEQKDCTNLVYQKENVCLCMNNDFTQYAIGSQSNITLIDPKTLQVTHMINSKHRGCGIRSISFQDNIVTIGTGVGVVMFYDLRARRYLKCQCGYQCNLTLGNGWLLHDANYRDFFMDQVYPNAIYTHCYDSSGTRLFVAGGPLPAGLYGNYASLWT